MKELQTDILIVGAGLGGCAAALSGLRMGMKVVMSEETDWIGGQLTAQGVPPDENPWIDRKSSGCTNSYRKLREDIRDYYRRYYPLLEEVKKDPYLNPGQGNVSPLCHQPRVALAVLESMFAPYLASQQLEIWLDHSAVSAECVGDWVRAVTLADNSTGDSVLVKAAYVLDATELGDLLSLASVEHVIGAESQVQTGELHALEGEADPMDQQSFSWCFAIDYFQGEDHTIEKPADYDFWQDYQADFWPSPQLSWITADPISLEPVNRPIFTGPTDEKIGDDLWHFRRVLYRRHYPQDVFPSDIVVVNWPQIDYWLGPLLGVPEREKQKHLSAARHLSLSMMYWMQTEAPRLDGGCGYPGLRLRGDVMGTNGLAKQAYIRESRRIQAEFTVLEQHVGVEARGELKGSENFRDSVGIGSYRIDLHPSTSGRSYIDITNWPFQIPLGALLPIRVENLLPAGKNIGTTHITNGCYRLHPVEWNIGEAAGALAAYCIMNKFIPRQVYKHDERLAEFQNMLTDKLGFELAWPEELRLTPRVKHDPLGI